MNKTTFIYAVGVKASFLAGVCFLFCLSTCLGAAEPFQNIESAVIISTEPFIASETDAIVPAPPPPQAKPAEIKLVPEEKEIKLVPEKNEIKVVPEATETIQHRVHKVWLWQETQDCLWNLAKIYYNDPWQWKKIYLANKSQIKDPQKIYPKQELIIPPADELNK